MRSAAVSAIGRTPLGRISGNVSVNGGMNAAGGVNSGGYRGKSLGRGGFGKR